MNTALEIVNRYYDATNNEKDADAAGALMAEDFVFVGPLRPRKSASALPPVVPPIDALDPKFDWLEAMRAMACSTVVTPCLLNDSTLITVTGNAVSALIRLMAEPVISMRCVSCAMAGEAARAAIPPSNKDAAALTFVRLNMKTPEQIG